MASMTADQRLEFLVGLIALEEAFIRHVHAELGGVAYVTPIDQQMGRVLREFGSMYPEEEVSGRALNNAREFLDCVSLSFNNYYATT